ncbi:unnamed protein product, partial [Phaeothamnion confervicola]
ATGPYVADAYDTRGIARSDKADCLRAITDVNVAIAYSAKHKAPAVRQLNYQYHVSAAYVHLNCAGDFDAALAVLDRASRLKPAEPAAFAGRALMYSEKGDFKSAHVEMAKALTLGHDNPTRAYVLAARGVILQREGRLDESMSDLDQAIGLNPAYASSYAERGTVWR